MAVSQAWEQLYQRFEKDGLLPKECADKHYFRLHTTYRRFCVAAAVAACFFFGWYIMQKTHNSDIIMRELHNEALATTLATVLEDGSVVYLSEQTSLRYPEQFAGDKREVALQGDAFFEIKKQAERPFFIDTDLARVEVTGTSFKIKSNAAIPFLLSVREGEVRVTRKNSHQTLTAKAGETVLYDSEQLQLTKIETGFDEYFQRILFKDEYLTDVAAVINRHADSIQLFVAPDIDNRVNFTYVEHSDIAEIAEVICQALNLQHTRQGHTIYISKQK